MDTTFALTPTTLVAVLMSLAAGFAYINIRVTRLPMTIGLMLISLLFAGGLLIAEALGVPAGATAESIVSSIDFSDLLLEGALGLLLFAGSIHVNFNDLAKQWAEIGLFATLGVVLSTMLVGVATWAVSDILHLGLAPLECFLFGALISPTDPIAVLGILKRAGAPQNLETKITGESLFNDGIGVVVFLVLFQMAYGGEVIGVTEVSVIFVEEVLGGLGLGLFGGFICYRMLKSVNHPQVEIMVTLALVMGLYASAQALHFSGPLASVVAGLLIGNRGRAFAMSEATRQHLDTFWELVDDILNALLFTLIGLEALVVSLEMNHIIAGLAAVVVALAARTISISVPVALLVHWRNFGKGTIRVMAWGGLRGGISVALALSLPATPERDVLLTMTYVVVAFSILVQGLTIKPLVEKLAVTRQPVPDAH